MIKKVPVVVYYTGDKEKDNAINKYCKKNKLKIVKTIEKDLREHIEWNPSIYDLHNYFTTDIAAGWDVYHIITYSLEDLDECLSYQMTICHFLADASAWVCTLKEGEFVKDFNFNCSFENLLSEEDLKKMQKLCINN